MSLSLKDRVSYFLSGSQRASKSTLVRCQSVMSQGGNFSVALLKRGQTPEQEVLTETNYFVSRQEKGSPTSTLKVLSRVQVPPAQETEAGLRAKGFRPEI